MSPPTTGAAGPPWRRLLPRSRAALIGLAVFTVGVGGLAAGEAAGWRFLAGPLQSALSAGLSRPVTLVRDGSPFRLQLLGGVRLAAGQLQIGAPRWSASPFLAQAQGLDVELRYADLWRAARGQALRVRSLRAAEIDVHAERLADGRASWASDAEATAGAALPHFEALQLGRGRIAIDDRLLDLSLQATLALAEGASAASGTLPGFRVDARGRWQQRPVKATLSVDVPAPAAPAPTGVAFRIQADIGRASLAFQGRADGPTGLAGLSGSFKARGPSLAVIGDALGLSLPTTAAFDSQGELAYEGEGRWQLTARRVTVGGSLLDGQLTLVAGAGRPSVTGRLGGQKLLLADLGPALGVPVPGDAAAPRPAGEVLPARPFDLAAMRRMDADVKIDIAAVDLGTPLLDALEPLRGSLRLADGVLDINDLDARTASGTLGGSMQVDGRGALAKWRTDLKWQEVRLERWLNLTRADGSPPWISGRIHGYAKLNGDGRSTAEILARLQGQLHLELRDGRVSHLALEAAGLDPVQALGLLFSGDNTLAMSCAVADLVARDGVLRPQPMVVDTADSVLWLDGTLSLAKENMDLRLVVAPRDFSPLSLRSPLRVSGPLRKPEVTVERGALAGKAATSLLLALVNPLAALLPLVDTGNRAEADRGAADCRAAMLKRPGLSAAKR